MSADIDCEGGRWYSIRYSIYVGTKHRHSSHDLVSSRHVEGMAAISISVLGQFAAIECCSRPLRRWPGG